VLRSPWLAIDKLKNKSALDRYSIFFDTYSLGGSR